MSSDPPPPSYEALTVLVQQLANSVAAMEQRLAQLEQHRPRFAESRAQSAGPSVTAAPPVIAGTQPIGASLPPELSRPPASWWQVGPLQAVDADKAPIVALAAAGGLAVLVGMMFFVWYAVERGWLSPTTRLLLGGGAGLAMLIASWPLADRNRAAAGGLGGAGLGTWFGVWLIARHVHGVVGPTEAFAGLAAAAAMCLVVAGLRGLRLMAILGALAAFATPIATATGADRLHELMIYQLLLMAALVALEQVRRWPELGHMAVGGTWLLMAGWASQHLDASTTDKLLTWTAVLLVITAGHTVLLRMRGMANHAAARHLMGGLFAWSVVTAATLDRLELMASLTLGMALWHLAGLGWSRSRGVCHGLHAVLLGLAWAQLFAFGPLHFEGSGLPSWWLAQGLIGALTVSLGRGWVPLRLAAAPLVGVMGWVVDAERGRTGLACGLAVALVLLVIALWPSREDETENESSEHEDEPGGAMAVMLLTLAAVVAGVVAELHLERESTTWAALAVAGVAALATMRAFVRLDPLRVQGTMIAMGLGLAWALGHVVDEDLLRDASAGGPRAAVAGVAVLLGAMGAALLVLLRRRPKGFSAVAGSHDAAGIVAVLGPALALQMFVITALFTTMPGHAGLWSLELVSISVIAAVAALIGLVAGLRLHRERWRKLALGGLVIVAAKLVFIDLSEVDVAYRVLSFVGLGACMLLGAIAYGRALQRTREAGGDVP